MPSASVPANYTTTTRENMGMGLYVSTTHTVNGTTNQVMSTAKTVMDDKTCTCCGCTCFCSSPTQSDFDESKKNALKAQYPNFSNDIERLIAERKQKYEASQQKSCVIS
jgi:hypothetical protein